MITIISLKTPSGKATDAVDTVNHNVFSNVDRTRINFIESVGFREKIKLLRQPGQKYMFGIGNITEIIYLPFKPRDAKYVISWHTLLRKTKTWPVRRIFFKKAEFVIAVSDCSAETVRNFFPDKRIYTVLNGVDTKFFTPQKADKKYVENKFGVDFSKPVVLFVGALFERKRPDVFIEIARRHKDANFVLIGRKTQKDFLSSANDIQNLKWIPFADREDIAIIMASSDIFLFPSVNEPCAAVLPEAMASGMAIVLSRSCGNVELIDDGKDGFLIDVRMGDIDEFDRHLSRLLDDKDLMGKMKSSARSKCENELNWQTAGKLYEKIFNAEK